MGTQPEPSSTPRTPLNRERVVRAAVALADEAGLEALSMRKLGQRLGVEAITGKPYKPTTQGKNERFHQTLFRYLDKQPLAESLAQLDALVHMVRKLEDPPSEAPGSREPRP